MNVEQYMYVLKLVPRLHQEANWTEEDNEIVEEHFVRLQSLLSEGRLLLAGPTLNELDKRMGIVVLQVSSEQEARELMENDPAVKKGVMTAELYPFHAGLMAGK